ncbi:MAG: hypothetical protein J6Z04_03360 [Clostridia bacterium]|nr:hypothetical protein [Clostridia bacterium]
MYTRSRQNKILSLLPTLALILCLVICAFAFASCGPKKPASTEPATTPATTDGNSGVCQHVWGEFEVDTPATCTAPGSKSKYCTICDAQDPDSITEIPQLAHTPADEFSIDKEPTCSAGGFKSKHCTVCGNPVADTVLPIDPDPTKHVVEHWTVTEEVNMFHQTGERTGECTACHQNVKEVLEYEPIVLTCTDQTSAGYPTESVYFKDILGDKHFYPTTEDFMGNDLLIEYSVLFNETMLDLYTVKDQNPYVTARINKEPVLYWSPRNDMDYSDCKYAGGFEWTGKFATPVTDGEVTTPAGMCGTGTTYADYPNILGADEAHPEYGWHRIQVRIHMALINEAALKAEAAGTKAKKEDYVATATVYVDGVAAFKLSTGTTGMAKIECNLFTAEADGNGGIKYEDGDAYVVAFYLNRTKAVSGKTAYVVISDINVTCGKDFKMPVERVTNPADATLEVAEDVNISAPVYFKLAD